MSLSCNLGSAPPALILTKPAYSIQRALRLFCGPRQVIDGTFQVAAFGRGRCEQAFPDPAQAIVGVEHAGILNRRSQPGRYPLHRFGLGDHLIDVIAIDALKRAQLESDARGPDTRQDHWSQTFGTGVGLNRYAAIQQG